MEVLTQLVSRDVWGVLVNRVLQGGINRAPDSPQSAALPGFYINYRKDYRWTEVLIDNGIELFTGSTGAVLIK